MKVIFMGTPDFAESSLKALIEGKKRGAYSFAGEGDSA